MLYAAILAVAFAQVPAGENWNGQVVAVLGDVAIERQQQQYRAVSRAGIMPGDVLATGDGSASFFLSNGAFVYMAPSTRVRAVAGAAGATLRLESGELRVVGGEAGAMTQTQIEMAQGVVRMDAGVLRIQSDDQSARLANDTGTILIEANGRQLNLPAGQEVQIANGQFMGPVASTGEGWNVDVDALQAEAMAEELRRRRRVRDDEPRPGDERSTAQEDEGMRRPPSATQSQIAAASISSASSGFSASPGATASAGLFADAQQSTNEGMDPNGNPFPGNIHLVTGETRYGLGGVQLTQAEANRIFPNGGPSYFSIGKGKPPTSQVVTDFNTASAPRPNVQKIPRFDAYVLRLDQYGPIDAPLNPEAAENNNVGYAGLLGEDPTAPTIIGAKPLRDKRSKINDGATFALGEFRLRPNGGDDNNSFELAIRRSDQDRIIIKDDMGNDANDKVIPNPDVADFKDVADPRFFPLAPTVKVPERGAYDASPTRFSNLNNLRRAATVTILADQLRDYSRRTGQTRFVIDGQVIDISGARRK